MSKKLGILLSIASLICIVGFVSANSPDRLVGSVKSNKYHYERCKIVKRIEVKNLRIFASQEEAVKLGYIPCKICQQLKKEN